MTQQPKNILLATETTLRKQAEQELLPFTNRYLNVSVAVSMAYGNS
jgi:hypothetical protein